MAFWQQIKKHRQPSHFTIIFDSSSTQLYTHTWTFAHYCSLQLAALKKLAACGENLIKLGPKYQTYSL